MRHTSQPTPAIAIIGTEGSGKTVLITTLAKQSTTIESRGVFLNPQGVQTLKYVERAWQTLQQGDWPPATPPGQLSELRWKLEIDGEVESEVRLVDAAGEDLRALFAEDRVADASSLPETLQKLNEYCRRADIVIFLINLRDFTGQGNPHRRTENEAAIKAAMDDLSASGRARRFCLVFTQWDLYRELALRRGGRRSLAKEAIPNVYGAYIKNRRIPVFAVSAVNKTTVIVDESGVPRRVPERGFGSDGCDELLDWLTRQVREVQASWGMGKSFDNNAPRIWWICWIVAVLFVLWLSRSCRGEATRRIHSGSRKSSENTVWVMRAPSVKATKPEQGAGQLNKREVVE